MLMSNESGDLRARVRARILNLMKKGTAVVALTPCCNLLTLQIMVRVSLAVCLST